MGKLTNSAVVVSVVLLAVHLTSAHKFSQVVTFVVRKCHGIGVTSQRVCRMHHGKACTTLKNIASFCRHPSRTPYYLMLSFSRSNCSSLVSPARWFCHWRSPTCSYLKKIIHLCRHREKKAKKLTLCPESQGAFICGTKMQCAGSSFPVDETKFCQVSNEVCCIIQG